MAHFYYEVFHVNQKTKKAERVKMLEHSVFQIIVSKDFEIPFNAEQRDNFDEAKNLSHQE